MTRIACRALMLGLIAVFAASATVFESREFTDTEQKLRYHALIDELRCLVCQNQNLADSDADLAADLRRQVYVMLTEGASDEAIIDFMVARYGEFVLYRPRLNPSTMALWFGPVLLVVGGLAGLLWQIRRRGADRDPANVLSEGDRRRVREALGRGGERP